MRRAVLVFAASSGLLLGLVGPAQAGDDATARSVELYGKGNKLYDEGKLAEAEAAYQAAWDLRKSFDLAGNLGDVELKLGQYRDAAEHFSYALKEFPAGGKPAVREELVRRFEEARKQVGSVKIGTSVGGAKIVVDGRDVGQAPLPEAVFVDPGTRVIEAKLEGYDDALATVNVEKGSSQEVSLMLVPKAGGVGKGKSIAVIAVGAGLGAAALGTGIGLMVAAGSKKTEAITLRDSFKIDAPCNKGNPQYVGDKACGDLLDKLKTKDTFQNVAVGAFVVGGVLAVGTVVYALLPAKKSTTVGVQVLPAVSPSFAGVSAAGHF
jgi:hypothetical protein